MKRFVFIFWMALLAAPACLLGQGSSYNHSVCWEITGKNLPKPSYILGSVHLLDTTRISFPVHAVEELIDRCELFCSEVNLTAMDSTTILQLTKQMFTRDTLRNVPKALGEVSYGKLIRIVDSARTELKKLKSMLPYINPAYLNVFVGIETQIGRSELYGAYNFTTDLHLEQYAVSKGYEIRQLESIEEQMKLLLNDPFEKAIENLRKTIDAYFTDDSVDLFERYANQDIRSLLKPGEYDDSTLVISRNIKMTEGIDRILKKNAAFIVIGAAHLPYEYGVLSLLKEKGYTIKSHPVDIHIKGIQKPAETEEVIEKPAKEAVE